MSIARDITLPLRIGRRLAALRANASGGGVYGPPFNPTPDPDLRAPWGIIPYSPGANPIIKAGAPYYAPLDFPEVLTVLRLDAAHVAVGVWPDQSGNHFDGTNTGDVAVIGGAFNGVPVARFHATAAQLSAPIIPQVDVVAFSLTMPFTIALVGQASNSAGTGARVPNEETFLDTGGGIQLSSTIAPAQTVVKTPAGTLALPAVPTAPNVYLLECNGAASKLYISAITAVATFDATGGSIGPTAMKLAFDPTAVATTWGFLGQINGGDSFGAIADVRVWDGIMDPVSRANTLAALGVLYSIGIGP